MKFLRAIGAVSDPEVSEDDRGTVIANAEQFLRAGGMLSIADWSDLSEIERDSFAEAGERISLERVALTGLASQSVESAAKLLAPVDGGYMFVQLKLEEAVDKMRGGV